MRRLPIPYLRCNKATSYAISAIIITAVTATLVMAVALYAYNVLDRQRGAAEFELAKKSILAFDDALQDAAWKLNASRTVRFKIEYGNLQLIPDATNVTLTATLDGVPYPLESILTGLVRYSTSIQHVTFAENYSETILGDEDLVVTDITKTLGRGIIEQKSNLVSIILSYRTRAMRTSYLNVNGTWINYVSVWLIKVVSTDASYIGDFDLKARCNDIETSTLGPFEVPSGGACQISVEAESWGETETDSATISLDPGRVVFSVVVAEVEVKV